MAGDFVIVRLGEQSVKVFLAQMAHDLDTTVPALLTDPILHP